MSRRDWIVVGALAVAGAPVLAGVPGAAMAGEVLGPAAGSGAGAAGAPALVFRRVGDPDEIGKWVRTGDVLRFRVRLDGANREARLAVASSPARALTSLTCPRTPAGAVRGDGVAQTHGSEDRGREDRGHEDRGREDRGSEVRGSERRGAARLGGGVEASRASALSALASTRAARPARVCELEGAAGRREADVLLAVPHGTKDVVLTAAAREQGPPYGEAVTVVGSTTTPVKAAATAPAKAGSVKELVSPSVKATTLKTPAEAKVSAPEDDGSEADDGRSEGEQRHRKGRYLGFPSKRHHSSARRHGSSGERSGGSAGRPGGAARHERRGGDGGHVPDDGAAARSRASAQVQDRAAAQTEARAQARSEAQAQAQAEARAPGAQLARRRPALVLPEVAPPLTSLPGMGPGPGVGVGPNVPGIREGAPSLPGAEQDGARSMQGWPGATQDGPRAMPTPGASDGAVRPGIAGRGTGAGGSGDPGTGGWGALTSSEELGAPLPLAVSGPRSRPVERANPLDGVHGLPWAAGGIAVLLGALWAVTRAQRGRSS
ncbi:hypothetical protein [Nonomuraea rhizosphaerae]|uniref:hypothetical protein n=1 Tax=Nonomuraea rhizosphaerae TaxID=2665663 RepID=UPI001C60235C|nr:hypothetical protein [Nonomuraea rhizosphaerae]